MSNYSFPSVDIDHFYIPIIALAHETLSASSVSDDIFPHCSDQISALFVAASVEALRRGEILDCLVAGNAAVKLSACAEQGETATLNTMKLAIKIERENGANISNARLLFNAVSYTSSSVDELPEKLTVEIIHVFDVCSDLLLKNGVDPQKLLEDVTENYPVPEIEARANLRFNPLLQKPAT